jgi:choline dehydrogenase-like flavoprotein
MNFEAAPRSRGPPRPFLDTMQMPIIDLRDIPTGETIEAELCIIGSGPAGATIARELDSETARIVVVECGGAKRSVEADALNEIESIGRPRVMDQWLVRNRILGGSSHTWTGRCAPLDRIDYEKRDWIPYSGWPLTPEDMQPVLDRAAPHLGLGVGSGFSDRSFWKLFGRTGFSPNIDEELLLPFFWQFSKDDTNPFDYMRFGKSLRNRPLNARILLNATVVNINTEASGAAVTSVDLRAGDGSPRVVFAPRVVLCAGGIENARLLLASRRTNSAGLGNQNDLVGRFLMDHPRGRIGLFDVQTSEQLQRWLGVYNLKIGKSSYRFRHGYRLSPDYQRQHQLLNSTVWLNEIVKDDDPWNALSRILRRRGKLSEDVVSVAANLGLVVRGLNQYLVQRNGLPRKLERLELICMVEQQPDPDSRITLSDRTDRFGVPISRVNWKVGAPEARTIKTIGKILRSEFQRLSLNDVQLDDWVARDEDLPLTFPDIAHPTGTTRMATSAKSGVVDPNCQVHGVNGLFVAGSSIFPTAGHANPTHMIVATAIRLADFLKKQIARERRS